MFSFSVEEMASFYPRLLPGNPGKLLYCLSTTGRCSRVRMLALANQSVQDNLIVGYHANNPFILDYRSSG